MGSRKMINEYYFYYLYHTENRSKKEICDICGCSVPTYVRYVQRIKDLDFTISTDFLERELMILFQTANDDDKAKLKLLDSMMKIWEKKSKVPNDAKADDKIDLSLLLNKKDDHSVS